VVCAVGKGSSAWPPILKGVNMETVTNFLNNNQSIIIIVIAWLITSEALPFVSKIKSNSVIQALVNIIKGIVQKVK